MPGRRVVVDDHGLICFPNKSHSGKSPESTRSTRISLAARSADDGFPLVTHPSVTSACRWFEWERFQPGPAWPHYHERDYTCSTHSVAPFTPPAFFGCSWVLWE